MASPLKMFRKNQKGLLVAIFLLSMFAFVFIGPWSRLGGGGTAGGTEDPVVFTWKYGSVRKSEINNRISWRQVLNRFLGSVATKAGIPSQFIRERLQFPLTENQVIKTILFNRKADEMGITVSDRVVKDFVREICFGRVSDDELAQIIDALSSDRRSISAAGLFEALRFELTANDVQEIFARVDGNGVMMQQGVALFAGNTPADRWDYYCRLNRKVTAEMLPVIVDNFVADVGSPTDDQLKKFYDQYKDLEQQPGSPTPGFKQPFKAQFQYFKADEEKLITEELPKVTDAEMKAEYEKHKDDLYKKMTLPDSSESKSPDSSSTDSQKGDSKAADKGNDIKSGTVPDVKSGAKAGDQKAADGKSTAKSGDSKSNDGKSNDSKSGGAKSTGKGSDTKGSTAPPANTKKSDGKQSRWAPANSTLVAARESHPANEELLALADDAQFQLAQAPAGNATKKDASSPTATKSDAGKTDTFKSDTSKSGASKTGAATPGAAKSDAGKSNPATVSNPSADASKSGAASTPPSAPQPSQAQTPAAPADSKGADNSAAGASPTTAPVARPVEYEPFEKVKDRCRHAVAAQKVDDRVSDAFSALRLMMDQYGRAIETYQRDISRGFANTKAPTPIDFAALAKQYGLDAEQTDLISQRDAYQNTDIGKSHQLVPGSYTLLQFVQIAYGPNLPKFQGAETEDLEKNRYLWWKTADEPAHTPKLDSIKADVTKQWKTIEARKPAQAKADEYAAEARHLNKPLTELFTNRPSGEEVFTAGPFSWMSRRLSDPTAMPTLTDVSGVKDLGNDFMKAVFALQPGGAGVAPNQSQTIFYVVQIESEEPPLAELQQGYITAMETPMASAPYAMLARKKPRGLPRLGRRVSKTNSISSPAPATT